MSCPMDSTSLDVRLFSVPFVNSSLSKVYKSSGISMFSSKNSFDGGGHLLKGPLKSFISSRIIAATFFTFSSVVLRLNYLPRFC